MLSEKDDVATFFCNGSMTKDQGFLNFSWDRASVVQLEQILLMFILQ